MLFASFLRYNGRHSLWFPRGSKYGEGKLVRLNPITSASHNEKNQRTWRAHEPLWLFRLRQRVFAFAGYHRCPERGRGVEMLDTWDIGPDGNRTCSCCGSIHPDDLMAVCRKVPADERYGVEGTTKSYKVYVQQPGVRNAGEGAIKFYKWHAPKDASQEDCDLFAAAVDITHRRFLDRMTAPRHDKVTVP